MWTWSGMTQSVADVLLLAGLAAIALTIGSWRLRRRSVATTLHADDEGASYSLSLVLVTPLYVLLICTIIECSLMMVVKLGTMNAAYAAARSAMVWLPAEPPRPEKVRLAAVQAMTPFSSSNPDHVLAGGSSNDPAAGAYFDAYQLTANPLQTERYVHRKYDFAMQATQVTIDLEFDERDSASQRKPRITATVEYEMPINVPGVGRFLGEESTLPGASFFSRKITSEAILDWASPMSENFRLGIGYDSDFE